MAIDFTRTTVSKFPACPKGFNVSLSCFPCCLLVFKPLNPRLFLSVWNTSKNFLYSLWGFFPHISIVRENVSEQDIQYLFQVASILSTSTYFQRVVVFIPNNLTFPIQVVMDQDGLLLSNSHFLRLWKWGQKHYVLALIFQDLKINK